MTSNRLNKLRRLPQSNATWLCTLRRAPFWIMPDDRPPYRPFLLLVVDEATQFIHMTDNFEEPPTPDVVLEILLRTMQGTLLNLGRKGRPATLLVDDAELARALAPSLAGLDIHCAFRASMPQVNATLLELEESINRRKPIPGLLSLPGVTIPLVAELYAAAADFSHQAPWRWLENWLPIEVRYPPTGRARYALVLGRGGETFGLSLYESLADLDVLFSSNEPNSPSSRSISSLSLLLEEATTLAFDDLDAIERYDWPVAGETAYPLALKMTPKNNWGELPSASDLAWLAAALRTIPDFVTRHLRAKSGLPRPAQVTCSLPGVHGNQQLLLRYPAQDTSPVTIGATDFGSTRLPGAQPDDDLDDLEAFIEDWHWDAASHEFARQMGRFLFQFLDHLEESGLSSQTIRKHERNCWFIGLLISSYGNYASFVPAIFQGPASVPPRIQAQGEQICLCRQFIPGYLAQAGALCTFIA